MDNTYEFYKIQITEHVKEIRFPIKMSSKAWQDIELLIVPYVLEKGDFDNLHLCWKSALASIVKKIVEKKHKYKKFTLKLTATEYYAIREFTKNAFPTDPEKTVPGLIILTVLMSNIKI